MPRHGNASVYLDHNATAPLRPEARAAVIAGLETLGNPSSVHAFGRRARARLEEARERIAARLGVAPDRVTFVSGATEANNLALAQADGPVLVSTIEHPSVLEAAPGAVRLPVGPDGRVDPERCERLALETGCRLVSVMLANNETGIVQPVAEIAARLRRHGIRLHVDAAQVPGRLALSPTGLGADFLALSAHKFGGPPGIGALVTAPDVELRPLLRGGGQERRARAGTENLPAAMGFAAALEAIDPAEPARLAALRDRLEEAVAAHEGVMILGRDVPRLANTSCIAMPGVPAELQVMRLDLEGIAVGAGSACSSGKMAGSHVLAAMGLPRGIAASAIRVSLGWTSTEAEVEAFLAAWERLRVALSGRPGLANRAAATT
ncbi:MAG TPA: cysteine desulfurase [Rhodospirillales bacterium]|nr:cysteine desulfurase [Rhodospirillales bacterium]